MLKITSNRRAEGVQLARRGKPLFGIRRTVLHPAGTKLRRSVNSWLSWFGALSFCVSYAVMSASSVTDDEKFDEGLRLMGFQVGQAYHCAVDKDQPSVESETLRRYTEILRLFGSDRAFLFAAAFGAGRTANAPEKSQCEVLLKKLWSDEKFGASPGKAKP